MDPTPRAVLLGEVADLVPASPRPLLLAVDGVDGSGKSCFADELGEVLTGRGRTVVRACVDDFHLPREHRHAAGRTAETVWSRSYDYRALHRELLGPWLAGPGSPYRRRWHDVESDEYVDQAPAAVPEAGVLVVDGVFTQRPELRNAWDLVVWLEVPFEVSVGRLAARDGSPGDVTHPEQRRYVDAQRHYLELCAPHEHADVVVDNRDLAHPVLRHQTDDGRRWRRDGDELVREVRVPADRPDRAAAIDRLLDG